MAFWEEKSLTDMTYDEWESLCDGCGRCCLEKLEDVDTGRIHYTNVACRLLDTTACRCTNYSARALLIRDCVKLEPGDTGTLAWMPVTCAYRTLHEGRPLPPWHPLVSGDPDSVHRAGISVRGRCTPARLASAYSLEDYLIDWIETDG